MDALSYKTKFANKATADKEWLLVDAENEVVGRLASKVAMLLLGKHKTALDVFDEVNFKVHGD